MGVYGRPPFLHGEPPLLHTAPLCCLALMELLEIGNAKWTAGRLHSLGV